MDARARLRVLAAPGRPLRAGAVGIQVAALLATLCHAPAQAQPVRVERHAAIYDSARERTVVYGGYDGANRSSRTWSLSLAETARWDSLTPNSPPSGRYGHAAVYDPIRDRMVVFGGSPEGGGGVNEVYALSLAGAGMWSSIAPSGQPPPERLFSSAVYDRLRNRMLVFGGGLAIYFADVWALSLGDTARWDPVAVVPGSAPTARQSHAAIYDPLQDRMIVFGGLFANSVVWQLSLANATWAPLSVLGTAPSARSGHTAVYDPRGQRMIVFGGQDGRGQRLNDVHALSLTGTPTWSQLLPAGLTPRPRFYHSAVYDSARDAMVVFGGDHTGNDETWALSQGSAPLWSPAEPVLALSSGDLQLQSVTVGSSVSTVFSITNAGLVPLNISAIRLPFAEMSLSAPSPLRLPWRATVTETLMLAAREPRTDDSLVIESDDPRTPRTSVPIRIDVRGLEFESRVLGSPAQVPLGVSFIVVVTPAPGVRVEQGTLYYRVGGSSADFDSVALTPLAIDFVGAVPAGTVTESGVEYYVQVVNGAATAERPPGAPSAGWSTQEVRPPASLTASPQPTSGTDFLAGRDVEVEAVLPDGANFVSGAIHYREGGAEAYETDTLVTDVLGRPHAVIPARVVGSRGVEYWIEVRTQRAELRFPAAAPLAAILPVRLQNLRESMEHPGGRYRLLSVPLYFGEDFSGSLDAILADQLGTYDPVQWRAFRYDPDLLRNLEFSSARAAAFRPVPGLAFWLVSRGPHRVDTGPIDGFTPATDSPYRIALAPGWNQFGNPFDFPVAWSDVIRDPVAVGSPVAFDPALGAAGDYSATTPSVLVPFEGYFVENVGAGPETLWVPRREAAVAPQPVEVHASIDRSDPVDSDRWSIRVAARAGTSIDGSNDLGVDPKAVDGLDALDLRKPPLAPGPWVRCAFANRDWDAMPGLYRRDLRSPGAAGHTWEVELRSATAAEPVTLELSAAALPPTLRVRIIDREQGNWVDLAGLDVSLSPNVAPESSAGPATNPARYQVLSLGPQRPYRLSILVGTEDYVTRASEDARVVPTRLTLDPNAPNPFRSATRIRFGLPRAARVSAEVFSVLGERVATLVDRARLEPGQHALIWDGRNSRGDLAPSGVYLLRLVSGDEVTSRRLVLAR